MRFVYFGIKFLQHAFFSLITSSHLGINEYPERATTWCSSPKCPEPNLPLLIHIQKKKLSWQWIDPQPWPHPRPIDDFAHHLTTLTPLEIKWFIYYFFICKYICIYLNMFVLLHQVLTLRKPIMSKSWVLPLQNDWWIYWSWIANSHAKINSHTKHDRQVPCAC